MTPEQQRIPTVSPAETFARLAIVLEEAADALEEAGSDEISSTRCHQVAEVGSAKLALARRLRAEVPAVIALRGALNTTPTRVESPARGVVSAPTSSAGRELDAQIAERVMDARWVYWPSKQQRRLVYDPSDWTLQLYQPTDVLGQPDDLADVHPYGTNLNDCARAEAHLVEQGRGAAYIDALFRVVNEDRHPDDPFMRQHTPVHSQEMGPLVAWVAMASARLRCLAMLAALEGH